MAIRTTRDDPAFAERFIAGVRERRAGRNDRTQFELIPDKYGGSTLAAVTHPQESGAGQPGELLIRAEAELAWQVLRRLRVDRSVPLAAGTGRRVGWQGDSVA